MSRRLTASTSVATAIQSILIWRLLRTVEAVSTHAHSDVTAFLKPVAAIILRSLITLYKKLKI